MCNGDGTRPVSNWTSSKFLVKAIKGSTDLKNKKRKRNELDPKMKVLF
jgi:hypothetical protein